jgi:hypothetical protein
MQIVFSGINAALNKKWVNPGFLFKVIIGEIIKLYYFYRLNNPLYPLPWNLLVISGIK